MSEAVASDPRRVVTVLLISPVDHDHVVLERCFGRSNWKLYRSHTLREGLALAREHRIPVILAEARFPRSTWKEVLHETERLPHASRLIVTSPTADDELWAEVLNLGGYDVLAKPLDEREMFHVVGQAWMGWRYECDRTQQHATAGVA